MSTSSRTDLEIKGRHVDRIDEILTPEALDFVVSLHRGFDRTRKDLLGARDRLQERLDDGGFLDFLPETQHIRNGSWEIPEAPAQLRERWVEITGPVDRKMMINALNSGASGFMADFEDANAPTWANVIQGQANLIDAVNRTIEFTNPDGRVYRLNEEIATLLVRPRGWHLPEKHLVVDGDQVAGGLVDFGLFMFHNARSLLELGAGPYFYLPKLESHQEARLWHDVFTFTEDALDIPRGSIRATVLVETISAAFEMDEILHELGEHACALNAGRWDYIFSLIKRFRNREDAVLPDRSQVTMTVPFMRAYTELLVKTCHKRGAHAMGGMAAFIPSRQDSTINEIALAKVKEDKQRETRDGFDGTWVAHPDLVPVARDVFRHTLGDAPNQLSIRRGDVSVTADDLLNTRIDGSTITEEGLRGNISVALQYIESWLQGMGAVPIRNLMEDVATAEIARAQIWQWARTEAELSSGRTTSFQDARRILEDEIANVRKEVGPERYDRGRFDDARAILERVAMDEDFVNFLTLPAYEYID